MTLILICSTAIIRAQSAEESPKIKKTIQASYSAKRTPEMPRDSVFTNDHLERYDVYDDNEKIIEYGQYDGEGNIYEITKIQKDESGNPIKGTIFDSKGDLKKYYTTTIDNSGNVTEFKNYNTENELESKSLKILNFLKFYGGGLNGFKQTYKDFKKTSSEEKQNLYNIWVNNELKDYNQNRWDELKDFKSYFDKYDN